MKTSTEQDYQQRIILTLLYVQEHLDDDIDLDVAANEAAFSRFHFHRVFRALVGEPLSGYGRRLRLERAARHLKTSQKPIGKVAISAGFDTHEAFTRAFRQMFGVSPSAYRDAHVLMLESPSHTHFVEGYETPKYLSTVDVKNVPTTRLFFLRHVGGYDEVNAAWQRLFGWANERKLLNRPIGMFGITHDDPDVTPHDKVRYDAALRFRRA